MDIQTVFQITQLIVSFGLIISSLEDIQTFPIFNSSGLLSWKVLKLLRKDFLIKGLNFIFSGKVFGYTFYLRLICSVLLFVISIFNIVSPTVLFVELLLLALMLIRSPYGLDGAYQMNLIILLGLFLGSFFGIGSKISIACLWFITAQLLLCYFTSGVVKLISPVWRNAHALELIFSTNVYGHPLVFQLVSKSKLIKLAMSWAVMLFETAFFVVFFLDPKYVFLFVAVGGLFHLSNAVFMGLNSFFFAFLATYPALIYCVYKGILP